MWLEFGPRFGAENIAVLFSELLEFALMWSLAIGAVVPMPTLTSAVAPFAPLILLSTRLRLCVTEARYPIAVALVMPGAPFAPKPTNVLPVSKVFDAPAIVPTKVFPLPDMLLRPALPPKKALELPKVFPEPASAPKKELLWPSVLTAPAL